MSTFSSQLDVLFIQDGPPHPWPTSARPYLCNENGWGRQSAAPEGALIDYSRDQPDTRLGQVYQDIASGTRSVTSDSGHTYQITEFDFRQEQVRYQPLPATRETAAAFGMTLLRSGECIAFNFPDLVMADYVYGKWAGYQSPYLGPGRGRELLQHNPTDLEFHAFPHVFFSNGKLPLVISVARWRPYALRPEIALADLWLQPGDALVLPPKFMPDPPRSQDEQARWRPHVDLHGNRNSAQACRHEDGQLSLSTSTILASAAAGAGGPPVQIHYHEEKHPTLHLPLP